METIMFNQILGIAKEAKTVAVVSHVMPDGDAIGSSCGLAAMLEKVLRRNVVLLGRDAVPPRFEFVPKTAHIKKLDQAPAELDLLFVVDCNNPSRTGDPALVERSRMVVNIDHHQDNTMFGDYNIVDTGAAATAHILARIFWMGCGYVTPWASACFYTGISTDTGGLQFGNLEQQVYNVMGYLAARSAIPVTEINRLLYRDTPVTEFMALSTLIDFTRFSDKGAIAYLAIPAEELGEAAQKCVPGYIRHLTSLKGVRVAMTVFNTYDGGTAYSLRGKGEGVPNLGEIARKHNGGGHPLAAGGYVKDPSVVRTLAEELLADVRAGLQ